MSFTPRVWRAIAACVVAAAGLPVHEVSAEPIDFPNYIGPFSSDNLPPQAVYAAVASVHRYGPVDEIQLRGSTHAQFSNAIPPPPSVSGAFTQHSFDSIIEGDLFMNDVFAGHIIANGQTTVRVVFDQALGNERFFDTELLQLDISGGNLPFGVLIRESPTLASIGRTAIRDIGGGQFQIASFFDVFTELSLDNGQSWITSNCPVTMQAVPEPGTILLLASVIAAGSAKACRRISSSTTCKS